MSFTPQLCFKIATDPSEFEQIYRLNYRTFVEEIPQHNPNATQRLVDKFHQENTYAICLRGDQLQGMIAIRGTRPFSLDQKLENLDSYLPPGRSPCEIRLLTIEKSHRGGPIFRGLLQTLVEYGEKQRYNLALISGTLRQQKLYQHLGFVPFGPVVGTNGALYQPMYLTLETWEQKSRSFARPPHSVASLAKTSGGPAPAAACVSQRVNLLPGPVGISEPVRQAFAEPAVSHRTPTFVEDFSQTKRLLCKLVNAGKVEIFTGSGTLANDVIAGQLSLQAKPGLILSNGEFGERLIDHATRFGLAFHTLQTDWGNAFPRRDIESRLTQHPKVAWLWAVHCETSTGVLNDIAMLKEICGHRGIQLCMDCIGSTGTVPVDLQGVYLASCVSGKGLGSFPGLSMVFYNHAISPAPTSLPRYLDLGFYAAKKGVPFTTSSNLVYALRAALERPPSQKRFDDLTQRSRWLRTKLRELGFQILAADPHATPAVITIVLPPSMRSGEVGQQLEQAGFLLSYNSEYLLRRNWIQICLMGECSPDTFLPLLSLLGKSRSPDRCGG